MRSIAFRGPIGLLLMIAMLGLTACSSDSHSNSWKDSALSGYSWKIRAVQQTLDGQGNWRDLDGTEEIDFHLADHNYALLATEGWVTTQPGQTDRVYHQIIPVLEFTTDQGQSYCLDVDYDQWQKADRHQPITDFTDQQPPACPPLSR